MSVLLAGLAPQLAVAATADRAPDASLCLPAKAIRADTWLTGLIACFSASAAFGAIGTLIAVWSADGPRVAGIIFATLTGAVLLARSRWYPDVARTVTLTVAGTATLSVIFIVAAGAGGLLWTAVATVMLTAGTLSVNFIAPTLTWSPLLRRTAELGGYIALAAIVPMACWVSGLYSAARGLSLS